MRVGSVLLFGAAGGIGRAIAQRFNKKENVGVILIDHPSKESELDSMTRKRGFTRFNFYMTCDVTDFDLVQRCMRDAQKMIVDKPNVLINAFGILPRLLPVLKTESAVAEEVMRVNFLGTFNCCKAFLPVMRERDDIHQHPHGRIINISSVMAQKGDPGNAIYAASKAAVESLTKSLALEASYGRTDVSDYTPGITVNAVAPGIIDTPMTAGLPEKALKEYKKRVPYHRKGTPEEVAEAVWFLATSPSYINGVILPVDGGYLAS